MTESPMPLPGRRRPDPRLAERRLRRLPIAAEAAFCMCLPDGNAVVTCLDLPPDLLHIGTRYDEERDRVVFLVASAAFDPVPEGGLIPEFFPTFRTRPSAAAAREEP